jgi:hypothetical protein
MKRTSQQITDTEARRLFQSSLPPEWVAREQSDDYGIDFEVEVFIQNQSTGIIFKAQLKGSQDTTIVDNFISQSIPIKNILYYLVEVKIPVFIIIADIPNSKVYWYAPQLDSELLDRAKNSDQNSLTVYVPVTNILPSSSGNMIQTHIKCNLLLSTQDLASASTFSFFDAIQHFKISESLVQSLQDKTDVAKLQLAYAKLIAQDFVASVEIIDRILSGEETNIETKFQALLYKEDAVIRLELNDSSDRGEVLSKVPLFFAEEMRTLTSNGPFPLRLFAIIARSIAIFYVLVMQEFSLFLNLKMQPDNQDPFIMFSLIGHRSDLVKRIRINYKQCWRLFNYAVKLNQFNLIPLLIQRFIPALNILFLRLRQDNLHSSYLSLRKDCLHLIEVAFNISVALKEYDQAASLANDALLLLDPSDSIDFESVYALTLNWLTKYPDVPSKSQIALRLENFANQMRSHYAETQSRKEISIEEEQEIYRRMAIAMGIRLDDTNDQISQIVNIGIRDLNPERVLRNCRHLFTFVSGGGVPAKMLNLPTAGFKRLHCLAKEITMEGLDLDHLYQTFHGAYCASCVLSDPYPKDWKWSRKWQQEQDSLHFEKLVGRHIG